MDCCVGVEREIDRVVAKFQTLKENKSVNIADALKRIRELKAELQLKGEEGLNPVETLLLGQTLSQVRLCCSTLASEHRELHSSVSKVGKAIDRNFVADFDSTSRPQNELLNDAEKTNQLNSVILQHFYRQGRLDLSQVLSEEANIPMTPELKNPFMELNSILEALDRRDLNPALQWAIRHRQELNSRNKFNHPNINFGSPLELRLHKLHFVELLRKSDCKLDAIKYAQTHFPQFVGSNGGHDREIQSLMGALMYAGDKLSTSPYNYLLNPSLWTDIGDHFVKDACALMGLAIESPLSVVINAGCTALPALLNIKQVMLQRQVSGVWNAKDELPIEIDLGNHCRYHSIFACPILRQQTSDHNPPLRLTCGHCISRDALNKLSNGQKLKCPYCPIEQNPNDARQITF